MAIDAKHEETVKLTEYITMEQEKIIEARIKFEEDCDRFNKYVKDVDYQTELAHKQAEEAIKERVALNEQIELLQQEIDKNERDWVRAEEFTK
jgi:transposase